MGSFKCASLINWLTEYSGAFGTQTNPNYAILFLMRLGSSAFKVLYTVVMNHLSHILSPFNITCIECDLSKICAGCIFISFHFRKRQSTFYPVFSFAFQQVLLVLQMLMLCLPGDGNLQRFLSHSSFRHEAF